MDSNVQRVCLELTVASAEEFGQAGEADRGLSLLREYRDENKDYSHQVTESLLRFGALHLEGPELKALLTWEAPSAETNVRKRYETLLQILEDKAVEDAQRIALQAEVGNDWLWHYPLGLLAWNNRDRDRAWSHFERYYVLSGRDKHLGGLFRRMARAFLTFMRECQVCGTKPAETHLWPYPPHRLLGVCTPCKELRDDKRFLEAVRAGEVRKDDPRLKALSSFYPLFDFVGERRLTRPGSKRYAGGRLRFHRVPTLIRRLSPDAHNIFLAAKELAKENELPNPDSCCLLVPVLGHMVSTMDPSKERVDLTTLGERARARIGSDEDCTTLREAMNIAWWSAALTGIEHQITPWHLQLGLAFAESGAASTLLRDAGLRRSNGCISGCSDKQKADLVRLNARLRMRFLDVLLHSFSGHTGYLWLIQNEPHLYSFPPRDGTTDERIERLLAWRSILKRDQSFPTMLTAWRFSGGTYPAVKRALDALGLARHKNEAFLGVLNIRPLSLCKLVARRQLNILEDWISRKPGVGDVRKFLKRAIQVASWAQLHRETIALANRYLDDPGTDQMAWHDINRAQEALIEAEIALENFDSAFTHLMTIEPPYKPGGEYGVIWLAQPLWTAGHRDEFYQVLARLKTLEDADVVMLDETEQVYRQMAEVWTRDEVATLQPVFLDKL